MELISALKEQEALETPLLLFECELRDGSREYWSTHFVEVDGIRYEGRVLRHDGFDFRSYGEWGVDGVGELTLTLANADSRPWQIERSIGWKGAKLTVRFLFYSLKEGRPVSDSLVLFRGVGDAPEEVTESSLRIRFYNRLVLHRIYLPEVRIQRRCPWMFPGSEGQRREALDGGERGRYSPFFRCGYSPDLPGGVGNLKDGEPYKTCDYSRAACEERGMFRTDAAGNVTARFGGIEFLPPAVVVRGFGERGWRLSEPILNQALYNDFVPIIYGTAWYQPPVVFARNDGNLTHMEVLLGMGELAGVLKVVVNGVELPEGRAGEDMTATGWYNVVSLGGRSGGFNLDFVDANGNPLGDPYGSMAYLSVVVPNAIAPGQSIPRVEVLARGLKLEQFNENGELAAYGFTANPAWVLLDVLRRCGWTLGEVDVGSFARAAAYCDELVWGQDAFGNQVQLPRYRCNLVLRERRSAAEVIRGIRNSSGLWLRYGSDGRIEVLVEGPVAVQQPRKVAWSNSSEPLNGGWAAYEFGDGTGGFSGILCRSSGEPTLRLWSVPASEVVTRYSVEFQDELNGYQQEGLSLVDTDEVQRVGFEVAGDFPALGLPNFHQAARVLRRQLEKNTRGNLYVEFETSVRGLYLRPGDIITVTYQREGLQRVPFRVLSVSFGMNCQTVRLRCQLHDDAWYRDDVGLSPAGVGRGLALGGGLPRPLVGRIVREDGSTDFEIREEGGVDGLVVLNVEFAAPRRPQVGSLRAPLVDLVAAVEEGGGTLEGGRTVYYAVSAVDAGGVEGELSFVVQAKLPDARKGYRARITGLRFPPNACAFHVYRGYSPTQLLRIASDVPLAEEFEDVGLAALPVVPPDPNYDRARIYWRWELVPEHPVSSASATTISSEVLAARENEYTGARVRITAGTGAGQERSVVANDGHTLMVDRAWTIVPDSTSRFVVAESSWRLGAVTEGSPGRVEVPARVGMTVHITGRSANAVGVESSEEAAPVTRWTIGTGSGLGDDVDVPPMPVFGLSTSGRGTVEVSGVGFETLENTRTVHAGTLILHYWNELDGASRYSLAAALDEGSTTVVLNEPGPGYVGALLQVGNELMVVEEVLNGGMIYEVVRGSHDSSMGQHPVGEKVYHLERKVFIIPFAEGLFGSPAAGSYHYSIYLPDVRVAAADLFVTNAIGNSQTRRVSFTGSEEGGLRTLTGGQITLQVEGYLAVEARATPPLVVERAHAVRDVFAVVQEAPVGGAVLVGVRQDDELYCTLTIPAGSRVSNVVSGTELAPLREKGELTLSVVAVPSGPGTKPGRDLTVTLRL